MFSPYFTSALALLAGFGFRPLVERLQKPRAEESLADLLVYGLPIDDGLLLNKNGSFTLGWTLRGPDTTSSTAGEILHLARVLHSALLPLQDRYLLNFDALRLPAGDYAPLGDFPDPVSRAIDAERRRAYESSEQNFVTQSYLTLTFEPPQEIYSRASKLLIEEAEPTETAAWQEHLEAFLRASRRGSRRSSSSNGSAPMSSSATCARASRAARRSSRSPRATPTTCATTFAARISSEASSPGSASTTCGS